MALELTFRPGEDFFVEQERFVVSEIAGPTAFSIVRERDGKVFSIVDDGRGAEITTLVMAAVGLGGQGNLARIAFRAPKSIRILRGENYRAAGGHKPR